MRRSIQDITQELAKEHKEYKALNTKKKAVLKRVNDLKIELKEIMDEGEMQQIKNSSGTFYFTRKQRLSIVDHSAFTDYIYSNKKLDLLYMHLNKEAEYLFEKERIPGVEVIPFKTLNVKSK